MKLKAVRKLKQKIIYQQLALYWSARRLSKEVSALVTRFSTQMSKVWSGNVKGDEE